MKMGDRILLSLKEYPNVEFSAVYIREDETTMWVAEIADTPVGSVYMFLKSRMIVKPSGA